MHIKHCILRSLDKCNIVVKTIFFLKSLAINYTVIWKNDYSVYYIQIKKKEWKDGVLLTKSDYSRTEETVIDKTFEWNTEDAIM